MSSYEEDLAKQVAIGDISVDEAERRLAVLQEAGQIGKNEVRLVDPKTGGMKGQKPVQLSMIPVPFLQDLGRVYAMGAQKYDRGNWRKGYDWHLSFDAAMRHMVDWWNGEERDPESGVSHLAHAAWHMATLHTFHRQGLGTDTRTPE